MLLGGQQYQTLAAISPEKGAGNERAKFGATPQIWAFFAEFGRCTSLCTLVEDTRGSELYLCFRDGPRDDEGPAR